MKKFLLAVLTSSIALSAQATSYPAECKELLDLTYQAMEVMPEMKDAMGGMDKDTMMKVSIEAWDKMSKDEQEESLAACKAGIDQMKQVIEMAKAQK